MQSIKINKSKDNKPSTITSYAFDDFQHIFRNPDQVVENQNYDTKPFNNLRLKLQNHSVYNSKNEERINVMWTSKGLIVYQMSEKDDFYGFTGDGSEQNNIQVRVQQPIRPRRNVEETAPGFKGVLIYEASQQESTDILKVLYDQFSSFFREYFNIFSGITNSVNMDDIRLLERGVFNEITKWASLIVCAMLVQHKIRPTIDILQFALNTPSHFTIAYGSGYNDSTKLQHDQMIVDSMFDSILVSRDIVNEDIHVVNRLRVYGTRSKITKHGGAGLRIKIRSKSDKQEFFKPIVVANKTTFTTFDSIMNNSAKPIMQKEIPTEQPNGVTDIVTDNQLDDINSLMGDLDE